MSIKCPAVVQNQEGANSPALLADALWQAVADRLGAILGGRRRNCTRGQIVRPHGGLESRMAHNLYPDENIVNNTRIQIGGAREFRCVGIRPSPQ